MYWNHILKLWRLTNSQRKKSLYVLLIVILLSSIAEVFTLGAVVPFVSILIAPEKFILIEKVSSILFFFKLESIDQLKLIVTLGFIITIMIAGLIRLLLIYLINRIGYLIGADLTQLIYSTSLSQNYEFHLNSNSSKMINILVSKINSSIQSTIIPFIQLVASLIISFFVLSMIIIIDPITSFYIMISLLLVYLFISVITNKILISNGKIISREHEFVMRLLQESSSGIREIILNQFKNIFINLFGKSDFILRKSQAMNAFIASSPRFLIETLAITIIALAAYLLTKSTISDIGVLPYLAMVIFAAQRLLPVMQQIYLSWASIQGAKANVEDMLDFYDHMHKSKNIIKKNVPFKFKKSLVFKDVSFKFSQGKEVIKFINFTIKKGDKIGIIGKTGSGKSTILNLLVGLIFPSSGEILIDEIKLTSDLVSAWQNQISSVSQNMFFLDDSIRNNVAFKIGNIDVSQNKIEQSLKKAELKEFVDNLENGQETKIGEGGFRLSGGQRQRIAIARALYKNHNVLILDEITSALDNVTEKKIIESIFNDTNKTVVIVSHKLQSLKKCNKIIKIDDGKIIKIGTYDEVITSN